MRRGSSEPMGMMLWHDPQAGAQLVAAHRTEQGLILSGDPAVLNREATDAFTASAPATAYGGIVSLPTDDDGPSYAQLLDVMSLRASDSDSGASLDRFASQALAPLAAPPTAEPVGADSPAAPPPQNVDRSHTRSQAGREPVLLTDGRSYRPRPVADTTDVQLLRDSRGALFSRIVGPSGTGKTMLAEAAFGDDLLVVEGHGGLTVDDLVGKWIPAESGAGYRFAYGPLAEAMIEGKVLLIDDMTRAPSDTINVLMGPADDRRLLVVDALPETEPLRAAKGFHVVATYNPTGVGVRPLDPAILRRFPMQIEATTDYGLVAELGVDARLVAAGRFLAERAATAITEGRLPGWAPQTDHLLKAQKVLDIGLGEQVAAATLLAACPEPHQAEVARQALADQFKYDVTLLVQR